MAGKTSSKIKKETAAESIENNENIDSVLTDTPAENGEDINFIIDGETNNADIETMISDISGAIDDLSETTGTNNKEFSELNSNSFPEMDINPNRPIACRSVYFGKLAYVNPITKAKRVWKDYGAVVTMPFSEFQSMHNNKPEYVEHPYLIIGDKDVVAYYNQQEMYKEIHRISKLDKIIKTGNLNYIRKEIQSLRDIGLKDTLVAGLRKMRTDKTLTNKDVIDIIKEELKLDLE